MKVETLHLGEFTQSLTLIDMTSIDMPSVYEFLPPVTSIHIQNCDEFKQQNFLQICSRLVTYKGLKRLVLELLSFDIEEVKDKYMEILQVHSDSLTHLSLARNKVSNSFMKTVCDVLKSSLPSL